MRGVRRGCESAAKREGGRERRSETRHSPVEAQGSSGQGLRSLAVRDIMPGGEGSSINLLDHHHHHRASTAATTSATDECANGDDVKTETTSTGATFNTNTMTSALPGDGLRRRKVIHAARETLDKGKSRSPSSPPFAVPSRSSLTKPRATAAVVAGTNPEYPVDSPTARISGDRSSFPNMIPPASR